MSTESSRRCAEGSATAARTEWIARPALSGTGDAPGINGNNVSLDSEFVTATKTTLQEQLLTSALTSKYGELSTVLKG